MIRFDCSWELFLGLFNFRAHSYHCIVITLGNAPNTALKCMRTAKQHSVAFCVLYDLLQ